MEWYEASTIEGGVTQEESYRLKERSQRAAALRRE